jgi:hypothetical protein
MIKILRVSSPDLGVRQDKIRRYIHSNECGSVVDFSEEEYTFTMVMYIRNLNCDIICELEKEFPNYTFIVEE